MLAVFIFESFGAAQVLLKIQIYTSVIVEKTANSTANSQNKLMCNLVLQVLPSRNQSIHILISISLKIAGKHTVTANIFDVIKAAVVYDIQSFWAWGWSFAINQCGQSNLNYDY